MKKIVLGVFFTLIFISTLNAKENDLLSALTKGALSDNSIGVKLLNLDEQKKVVGGYKVGSVNWAVDTFVEKPAKNNYNATDKQKIYSDSFMKCYYSGKCK